ncbi:MAG: GerMN domain-containing protein [Bacillota bacterium]
MLKKFAVFSMITVLLLIQIGCGQAKQGKDASKNADTGSTPVEKRPLILSNEKDAVLVYFASENGKYLVPVTLPMKPTKEAAKVAVEKILAGPGDWLLKDTVPEDTKLRDIYIRSNIAYIDLTRHFLNQDSYEAVELAVKSLALTLAEFPEVNGVQLLIEGRVESEIHGYSLDSVLYRPKLINSFEPISNDQEAITVYYADPNALYLIPVNYGIKTKAAVSEKTDKALKLLVKGPPLNSDLVKTIWTGTKIRNLEYDADKQLVTIDFSKEIIGYGGGSAAEVLLVNSLVYTLTSIEGVDFVQILIEGKSVEHLPEGWDISKPMSRPEHINFISP